MTKTICASLSLFAMFGMFSGVSFSVSVSGISFFGISSSAIVVPVISVSMVVVTVISISVFPFFVILVSAVLFVELALEFSGVDPSMTCYLSQRLIAYLLSIWTAKG